MQSKATTIRQYLDELAPDRRAAIEAVRKTILDNLDKDYEEGMQYGMIGYYVPQRVFPPGYHCDPRQPLPFAGLASQKNHMSLYVMSAYGEGGEHEWLRREWAKTGKKLDMGKCCIRFKKLDDLALDVIGRAIRRVPAKAYVAEYQRVMAELGRPVGTSATKSGTKPSPAKKRPAATKAAPKKTATRRATAAKRA